MRKNQTELLKVKIRITEIKNPIDRLNGILNTSDIRINELETGESTPNAIQKDKQKI